MKFIKVKIIKIDLSLKLGNEIQLEIIQFHIIKTYWTIRLTDFKHDEIITDTQDKGPFIVWIQGHCFNSKDDTAFMTDKVSYELVWYFRKSCK